MGRRALMVTERRSTFGLGPDFGVVVAGIAVFVVLAAKVYLRMAMSGTSVAGGRLEPCGAPTSTACGPACRPRRVAEGGSQ
jgi:hypothetical protein